MVTERMRRALDAGCVISLFQVLKNWPSGELRALIEDCETYSQEARAAITAAYRESIFKPEVFFSRNASAAIDKAAKDGVIQVLGICSEICSVAFYYLGHDEETPATDALKDPKSPKLGDSA